MNKQVFKISTNFDVKENLLNLCPKPHSVTDYNIPKYSKVLELRPSL